MYHFVVFSCNVSLFPGSFCSQLSDSFMPSLTKPRRHRIFEVPAACHSLRQEKNSQHRHCHAVFNHHSRHPVREYRLHNRLEGSVFGNSQQHTLRKRRTLQVPLRGANVYSGNHLSREFPAALQSELSYADWLNCCDKGWILVHPEKTWSGQDFVRPLAKGEKPFSGLCLNPTKTPKN